MTLKLLPFPFSLVPFSFVFMRSPPIWIWLCRRFYQRARKETLPLGRQAKKLRVEARRGRGWSREVALQLEASRSESGPVELAVQLVADLVDRLAVEHAENVGHHPQRGNGHRNADQRFPVARNGAAFVADAGGE